MSGNLPYLRWCSGCVRVSRALLVAFAWLAATDAMEARAASIQLAWEAPEERLDGSPLTDLAGYRVYYGTNSGNLSATADVGPTNTVAIEGLEEGRTYFFRLTTLDSTGRESPPSAELAWNSLDQEVDGLPDAWETEAFGSPWVSDGAAGADWDGDGQTDRDEYVTGTEPANGTSSLHLLITPQAGGLAVEFLAVKAEGAGYEGRRRIYALDFTPDPRTPWSPHAGWEHVEGEGQLVRAEMDAADAGLFRLRCWLQ